MPYLAKILAPIVGLFACCAAGEEITVLNPAPTTRDLHAVHFVSTAKGFAAGLNGSLLATTDGGKTWRSIPTGTSSHFRKVTFGPDGVGYAFASHDEWLETRDGGSTWTAKREPGAFERHFFDARNGVALFKSPHSAEDIALPNRLATTSDGGATWTTRFQDASLDLNNLIMVGSRIGFATGRRVLRAATGNPQMSWIVLRTEDGGMSWTLHSGPTKGFLRHADFPTETVGYAALDGERTELVKTVDGGAGWKPIFIQPFFVPLAIDFLNADTGYVVGQLPDTLACFKTTDGGAHWTRRGDLRYGHAGLHALSEDALYAVGYRGAIAASADGAGSWTLSSDGPIADLVAVHFPERQVGFVAGYNGFIARTVNGGADWVPVRLPESAAAHVRAVRFRDARKGWVAGDFGILLSTADGGGNWSVIRPRTNGQSFLALDLDPAGNGYAVGDKGTIVRIEADGRTTVVRDSGPKLAAVAAPAEDLAFAAGDSGVILKTMDGGRNWIRLRSGVAAPIASLRFFDARTGIAHQPAYTYVEAGGVRKHHHPARLVKTVNGGETWTTEPLPPPEEGAFRNLDWANPAVGYAFAPYNRLFKTVDGGKTWSEQALPIKHENEWETPYLQGWHIPAEGPAYAVGGGGLILKIAPSLSDPIRARTAGPAALRFAGGVLRFSLPVRMSVSAALFDLRGKILWQSPARFGEAGPQEIAVPLEMLGRGAGILRLLRGNEADVLRVFR